MIDLVKHDLRGFYDNPVVLTQNAAKDDKCKTAGGVQTVYIKPSGIKLTLKTVTGYENDPTAGLVTPLGVLAIDPSYTGAYSRATTQSIEVDLNSAGLVNPDVTAAGLLKDSDSVKLAKDVKLPDHPLYSTIVSMGKELLAVDHKNEPCLKPTDVKSTVLFDVVNKTTGGVALKVFGVKIGDKVTLTDEFHQVLEIDFSLQGSSLLAPAAQP